MPGRPLRSVLRLPRQWNKRIRSAVLHAISLAQLALTAARAQVIQRDRACDRLASEIDRLRQEIHLLCEEMRLKDARMARIPGHRRPYYQPLERLAILELRAAHGWSLEQTAERMVVTSTTIASWMGRLDEEGPGALVQMSEPVNKFPAFVAYLVRRLKVLCPAMGKARIAHVLCRAGLHLSATTVGRILKDPPRWQAASKAVHPGRSVRSTQRVMGFAIFTQQPTSAAVRAFLGRAIRTARSSPRHLITDHGNPFTGDGFRRWCRRRGIRQRFGAVEKYGSLSVVERLIRTIKNECTRELIVPYDRAALRRELALFVEWYNGHRPHRTLEARTPDEVYFDLLPACRAPRVEPRRRWPRGSPCAGPQARVRGRRGQRLDLRVSHLAGRKHLPIVELTKAA